MSMNENEFEYNGKTYASKPARGCKDCAFLYPYCDGADCGKPDNTPSCIAEERADHTSVSFIEKPKILEKKEQF